MRILKSNKMLSFFLIIISLMLIFSPQLVINSSLNAISVWALKIFPVMFPFFVLTRLIINLSEFDKNPMDKLTSKMFNAPEGSANVFLLSILAGYPTGAKLICNMYEKQQINKFQAEKMLSFCSVSGPMFMVGSVGVAILSSFKAGIIILIANILAAIINGVFYRGKKQEFNFNRLNQTKKSENILFDAVYDSIISILIVAAFIILSFLFVDLLNNLNVFGFISSTICGVFNCKQHNDIVSSFISGLIEMTRGIIDLNTSNALLKTKIIISSGLIGFGGLSVMLQSLVFLSKIKMPFKKMLKQKVTQAIFATLICAFLCNFI